MRIEFYETKTILTKDPNITTALIAELEEDVKVFKECPDIFSSFGNEQYTFNTKIEINKKRDKLSFRIDCATANDKKHPNSDQKKLMYLQVQDSETPSKTYANVVYPKDAKAEDIVRAIIESLQKGKGCYLVC